MPYGENIPTLSILAVPLRIQERIIGMLSAQSYHEQAYTADDQELLEMLATQAANALENARLFEEVQRAAADLELRNRRADADFGSGQLAAHEPRSGCGAEGDRPGRAPCSGL